MTGPGAGPGAGAPGPGAGAGAREAGEGSGAGHTWWGRAWLEALEQRARLDPNRLPRGREYARSGAVGDLVLVPGEARARVQGRKTSPYEVRIRVRRFADGEWDRVLDSISAQLGRAAAMLDGELPPEVAGDVAAAGLDLLPGAGEVGPRCSCPDDADPCKHSAAVCYLVADALDADPFAVLLLRGRTRGEVLAGLRARRRGGVPGVPGGPAMRDGAADVTATVPAPTSQRDHGVDARAAFASQPCGPVPVPPMPPRRPGHPAALPVDPPSWRGSLRDDLLALAADAAARAWEAAVGLSADAGLGLDADADLARRAERTLGTPAFTVLADRSGVKGRELARRSLAWRYGEAAGLELLLGEWDPAAAGAPGAGAPGAADAADLLKSARAALAEVAGAPATVTANRVTAGGIQLRLGRDLLWYPYARSDGDWEPAGPCQADPARAAESL